MTEARKMWIKATEQFTYHIISEIENVLSAGVKDIKRHYIGVGEDAGYSIYLCEGKYLITDKISDDIEFSSNIPQISGANGTFTPAKTAPTRVEVNYGYLQNTLFKNGNYYIAVGQVPSLSGIGDAFNLFTNGLTIAGDSHYLPRYDRTGLMKTFFERVSLNRTKHNDEFILTHSNQPYRQEFLITDSENSSEVNNDADDAFDAREYKYSTEDAGNWTGWWRDYADGVVGDYQSFGGATGTKITGYLKYLDDANYSYVLGFDITKADNTYSVISKDNGNTYTKTGRPDTGDAIFTNANAEPQSITLSFDSYTAHDGLVRHFNIGTVVQ